MALRFKLQASPTVLGLCALLALPAAAYLHPLSEEAVREAYFLGRSTSTEKLPLFLEQYTRRFPAPAKGPHVAAIEFRTPYVLAVLRSRSNSDYNAQRAEIDYRKQPDLLVVRVLIYWTRSFPRSAAAASKDNGKSQGCSEDGLPGFRICVAQDRSLDRGVYPDSIGAVTREVEPRKVSRKGIFMCRGCPGATEVILEFDAAQFSSGTVHVEVAPPEGPSVKADFDLSRLQ